MAPYYESGGIAIFNADVTSFRELGISLAEVTTVHADPMYGIKANTATMSSKRGDRKTPNGQSSAGRDWDLQASDAYAFDPTFWVHNFKEVALWGANHFTRLLPASPSWVIWDKRCGRTSDDGADCEMAWTNFGGPARLHSHLWRGLIREGVENASNGPKLHPFQKPLSLMRMVLGMSKTSGTILVPFGGSAPEVVVARELGRKCIVFEIEERFCEVAANRLSQEVLFQSVAV